MNDFGNAPIKGEGMATDFDYYDNNMRPHRKPLVKTTWIEFSLPEHLEDECWEMIKQWLKAKGATHD